MIYLHWSFHILYRAWLVQKLDYILIWKSQFNCFLNLLWVKFDLCMVKIHKSESLCLFNSLNKIKTSFIGEFCIERKLTYLGFWTLFHFFIGSSLELKLKNFLELLWFSFEFVSSNHQKQLFIIILDICGIYIFFLFL